MSASIGEHSPSAKKVKRGEEGEMQGMHLPDHVLESVVGFCDIPELGKLSCVSKALNRMTSKDELWERPLQTLLQSVRQSLLRRTEVPIRFLGPR